MTKKNNFPKMLILMTLTMGAFSLALMLFATTRDQNNNKPISIDLSTFRLVQLEEPKVGDQIAIVDTTIGEVRFKLYPEYAPEAVNNFVKLAESGAYNDTYVFDAQNGAYSAMGAPNRNGSINGSYSQDSEHVERELHLKKRSSAAVLITAEADSLYLIQLNLPRNSVRMSETRLSLLNSQKRS